MRNKLHYLLLVATAVTISWKVMEAESANVMSDITIAPGISAYRNYVKNPIARLNSSNITVSSASKARDTDAADKLDGYASILCDASSQNGYCEFDLDTILEGDKTGDCEFSGLFKGDASLYKAQITDGSTAVASTSVLGTVSDWTKFSVNYPCGATRSVRFTQTEAGTGAAVNVGRFYYGRATNTNVSAIIEPEIAVSLVPGAGFGTVSANAYYMQRVGNVAKFRGTFKAGTLTAATAVIALPSGMVIDSSKFASTSNVQRVGHLSLMYAAAGPTINAEAALFYDGSDTANVYVGYRSGGSDFEKENTSVMFTDSDAVSFSFEVPILGWASSGVSIRQDQVNYDWTSYTPGTQGFGTIGTTECLHKRSGGDMLLRCKVTSGTSTATEARVNLPNSLVSAGTDRIPSIQASGSFFTSTSAVVHGGAVLVQPSVGYVNFSREGTFGGNVVPSLTPADGNLVITTGDLFSFEARVPIAGWSENQNAPVLVGGVTSNSTKAERLERAWLTSVCAITSQSGTWITNAVHGGASTGVCTITITGFSDLPNCVCTAKTNSRRYCTLEVNSATEIVTKMYDDDGADQDTAVNIICMGPR